MTESTNRGRPEGKMYQDTPQDERKNARAPTGNQEIPLQIPTANNPERQRQTPTTRRGKGRAATRPKSTTKINDRPQQETYQTPMKPKGHLPPRSMQTQPPTPKQDQQTKKINEQNQGQQEIRNQHNQEMETRTKYLQVPNRTGKKENNHRGKTNRRTTSKTIRKNHEGNANRTHATQQKTYREQNTIRRQMRQKKTQRCRATKRRLQSSQRS